MLLAPFLIELFLDLSAESSSLSISSISGSSPFPCFIIYLLDFGAFTLEFGVCSTIGFLSNTCWEVLLLAEAAVPKFLPTFTFICNWKSTHSWLSWFNCNPESSSSSTWLLIWISMRLSPYFKVRMRHMLMHKPIAMNIATAPMSAPGIMPSLLFLSDSLQTWPMHMPL